jgi:hypothetical protein
MNPIALCAEATLLQHPHPALRLSELLELVAERVDRTLDEGRLRSVLERHPDRFRVLDPWRGAWRSALAHDVSEGRRDVWVLAVAEPGHPPDGSGPVALKLRESVRWLGRGIDPRSPLEVGRWHALVIADRALREAMSKRAA